MRKSRTNGIETKRKLLRVALKLFAEKGHNAVGIREIARVADVSLNTVMYHFESKDNLFRQTVYQSIQKGFEFERIFSQYDNVDFSDRQAVANAFHSILKDIFKRVSKRDFASYSDVIIQALFGSDKILLKALIAGFEMPERYFIAFLEKAGITNPSFESQNYWMTLLWSQVLYYASAKDLLQFDYSGKLDSSFYEGISYYVAKSCCHEIGLPDPQM